MHIASLSIPPSNKLMTKAVALIWCYTLLLQVVLCSFAEWAVCSVPSATDGQVGWCVPDYLLPTAGHFPYPPSPTLDQCGEHYCWWIQVRARSCDCHLTAQFNVNVT